LRSGFGFGRASNRVGKYDGESVAAVAEVAGLALFAGGIAAAAAVAEYQLHLQMADYCPFVAVGLAGLVQSSWACAAVVQRRMGWRALGPWWVGRVVT